MPSLRENLSGISHAEYEQFIRKLAQEFGVAGLLNDDTVQRSLREIADQQLAGGMQTSSLPLAQTLLASQSLRKIMPKFYCGHVALQEYQLAGDGIPDHTIPWTSLDIKNYRRGWIMIHIHEKFLHDLRDGLIETAGLPGLAFTMEKIKGPQDEDLCIIIDNLKLSPEKAVLFLEAHLNHLGVALTGSKGFVHSSETSVVVQIVLATKIHLGPEILQVTPALPCPEPEMTLYCTDDACGYHVTVKESQVLARIPLGCVQCKVEELRYELCLADGSSLSSSTANTFMHSRTHDQTDINARALELLKTHRGDKLPYTPKPTES